MIRKFNAIFDGQSLRPQEPLNLEPNTLVSISIEMPDAESPPRSSFLDTAQRLNLDGPADWSQNVDSYLYEQPDQGDIHG